jgi:dipeptidyl aminopeptidase/acylaminoacyl peptidase
LADPAGVITAHDLATIRDLGALQISPDRHWAAFLTRKADPRANAYAQAWEIVATGGGPARRLADGGDPIQVPINGLIVAPVPVWSPDSRWIAYLRNAEGRVQVWRARIDGKRSEQLTRNAGDADALVYTHDGRRLLFQVEPSQAQVAAVLAAEGTHGFHYDRRFSATYSPTPLPLAEIGFGTGKQRLTRCGPDAWHQVWVYDFVRRHERPANEAECAEFTALTVKPVPKDRPAFRENAAVAPSGALAWTEARDPDRQGGAAPLTIVAQPPGTREPNVCAAAECTGQGIKGLWWRNADEVIFARGEGSQYQNTALYAWRPGQPAARFILRTPGQLTSSYEWKCAIARDRLICFYEEPARPRRLVAVDLDSGAIDALYDPNPGFARFDLGPAPQQLEFRSPSGATNYGYLVLPPGRTPGARLPLVIVTYRCGGFLRGGVGDEYPIFPFAAQGIAVLCFSVPDPDYERLARMDFTSYENWNRGVGDPGKQRIQEGLESAIARLDAMGVIDPTRVGVTGLSYGGEAVMYALFHMPRLAAAIASGTEFGPANVFLYGAAGHDLFGRWGLDRWDSPRWDTASITRNAERVYAPLLLNVADHEMIDAMHPYTALEQAGRAVEMYVFPSEHHIKSAPAHRLAIYQRNIDWMNFWLRGVEDPDSAKAAQYQHWRALRDKQCKLFTGPDASSFCVH